MTTTPALEIHSLAKSYRAGVAGCGASARVLEDVSLRLQPGEVVGVSGGEGVGKTTLLLCAAGVLRADTGHVRWFGCSARRTLDGGATGPPPSVVLVPAPRASSFPEAGRRVNEPGRFAVGRRQALVPAAVSATPSPPRLLLLDEPALLHTRLGHSGFSRLLCDFAASGGAVLIVSRSADALAGVATRLVTLADGRLTDTMRATPRLSIAESHR